MGPFLFVSGPALLAPAFVTSASALLPQLVGAAPAGASSGLQRPAPGALHLSELDERSRPYQLVGGVAIVPVCGLIVPRFDWIGWSYATGCNVLRLQLGMAFADPRVQAVVLWCKSGGGFVSGVADLVDWAAQAKAAAGKPVAAILDDYAYSAAYWIAAGIADTISVPRTGGLGSIGVISIHWDVSAALSEAGWKPTIIAAGKHKAEGNAFQPLPDDVRDRWLSESEAIRQLFADTVARGRKTAGASLDLAAVLATEAATWDGPNGTAAAVEQGFADAVLPPDDAFQALLTHLSTAQGA
ncbi:S49 family peptidase [Azospirillum picis]|uniref:ClpP class serine protease n=1 Tax=Azospirillum picis TaxID=488438 RepID=A0ABU0MEI1_9PROT|nr:S49 family peptidase [Azospirillum picis]MBP2297961.1 ClpP class serine protease [Azospirillum picis]MDQ0531799.1 ClpP class serine protease [Azospirillum picis]